MKKTCKICEKKKRNVIRVIPLEKDIQNACCEYLELKRHLFWRQNTAPVYDPTKKVFRSMPKYAMKGIPDIIVLTEGGYFVGIEVKRPGGKPSKDQKEFAQKCQRIGAEYHIVTSLDQLKEIGL